MDLGFDGASMGEIARAAGVSKGTLYVYFADKNRLFEAIVEEEELEQGKIAFNFDPARDVETTLRGVRPRLYPDPVPAQRRLGGPHRDGDRRADAHVGRRYDEQGAGKRPSAASPTISSVMQPGDLAIDDCQLAASQFMPDVPGFAVPAVRVPGAPAPSAERAGEVVDSATRIFLAAYRAKVN